LREANSIPKTPLPQSEWEKLALRNKREFLTVKELENLLGARRTHWVVQAIIVGGRLLKKFHRFPNKFLVFNVLNFAVRNRSGPRTKTSRCFALCHYLLELFGTTDFLRDLVLHPLESQDVVHSTSRMSAAAEGSSSEEDSDEDDNINLLAGSFLRTFGDSQSSPFAYIEQNENRIRKTM
jgi:hypothetical protein